MGSVLAWYEFKNSSTANDKWFSFLYPSFYLKVIDQNNDPIANATIKYTNGSNSWLGSNKSYGTATTNKNGVTEFYLDGRVFGISDIHKDGYHIDFHPQLRKVSHDTLKRLFPANLKKFNYNTPLIINTWKFGNFPNFYSGTGSLKLLSNISQEISLLENVNTHCLKGSPFFCGRKKESFSSKKDGLIQVKIQKEDNERKSVV